jgi:hypothetical protein
VDLDVGAWMDRTNGAQPERIQLDLSWTADGWGDVVPAGTIAPVEVRLNEGADVPGVVEGPVRKVPVVQPALKSVLTAEARQIEASARLTRALTVSEGRTRLDLIRTESGANWLGENDPLEARKGLLSAGQSAELPMLLVVSPGLALDPCAEEVNTAFRNVYDWAPEGGVEDTRERLKAAEKHCAASPLAGLYGAFKATAPSPFGAANEKYLVSKDLRAGMGTLASTIYRVGDELQRAPPPKGGECLLGGVRVVQTPNADPL